MRIGLDARTLYSQHARGTGRNLRDVLRALAPATPLDTYLLYHRPSKTRAPADDDDLAVWPNMAARCVDLPGDRFDLWFNLRLPIAARADGVDVLHAPANAAPAFCPVPIVVTIHDLIPLDERCGATPGQARRFERGVRHALRVAACVITPSEFTRRQLAARFGIDPARITVVPWAPDTRLTRSTTHAERARDDAAIRTRFDLADPWILNFSGRSARKNATRLITAFAELPKEQRDRTLLVMTGCEPAATREQLVSLAHAHGIADRCRILGFQEENDAAALLRGAAGLAIPSLAEGFGLPLVDAMSLGIPVLASGCTSLPEVAGDAAIYVDPECVAGIRDGLVRLLDPSDREERIDRGLARAASFTWERTASLLHAVYDRCAQRRVSVRRKLHAARIGGEVQ